MKKNIDTPETKVFALGGLEEIGKNTYCMEHDNELIICDAGVKFPDEHMFGIDAVIPNYTYLQQNKNKIKALLVTHGHEDHIGGIPYLLSSVNIPIIYAPKLATELIKEKLKERKLLNKTKIVAIDETTVFKTKYFEAEFFSVNHSIPDAYGIAIKTPNGRIVTTGDFKFDWTPIGNQHADVLKLAELGKQGVTLFMADSTNAEVDGYTMTEIKVIERISALFANANGRILISTFASNVNRIQQIIEVAHRYNRKILVFGRSLLKIIRIVQRLNRLSVDPNIFIKPTETKKYKNNQILIICTGSQGEPLAALSRIADNRHQNISIIPGDTVIFSSSPIPGNRASVENICNKLTRLGALVQENSPFNSLHTSGHASQEEQKLILTLVKPSYFMPMHGDYRMLKQHAETSVSVGVKPENALVCSNGDVLSMRNGEITVRRKEIPADAIYVDGRDMSGAATAIIHDREIMGHDGVIVAVVTINSATNKLVSSPLIISRGTFYVNKSEKLIKDLARITSESVKKVFKSSKPTFSGIKRNIKQNIGSYVFQTRKRNPLVVPLILNQAMVNGPKSIIKPNNSQKTKQTKNNNSEKN